MDRNKIESGVQMFSRLNQRPPLENINRNLFENTDVLPNSVIEVTGTSGTGKTLFLTDLLARCILPQQHNNISLPGKNCGAIIVDTDHQLDLLRLIEIMEHLIRNCSSFCKIEIENIIKDSLQNLIILNCYDSQQFHMTFCNLESVLGQNANVSLVVIDSLTAYYWEYRLKHGIISIQSYCDKLLTVLWKFVQNSNVITVFTRVDAEMRRPSCNFITLKIVLTNCGNNSFTATLTKNNYNRVIPYVIEKSLVFK